MSVAYHEPNKTQILDLLHLSRKEKEIRDLCHSTFEELRQWQECVPDAIHSRVVRYTTIRGIILRSQARDAVALFRMARRTRIACFQSYIAGLPKPHRVKRLA